MSSDTPPSTSIDRPAVGHDESDLDRTSDGADPSVGRRDDGDQSISTIYQLSDYVLALAVVLFGGVALALFVEDNPLANTLTMYGFYVFCAGLGLRLVELALPDRLSVHAAAVSRRAQAFGQWVLDRKWVPVPQVGSESVTVQAGSTSRRADRRHDGDSTATEVRTVVGLAIPLTAGLGLLTALFWWVDPLTALPLGFLSGWLLALTGLGVVYALLWVHER